MFNYLQKIDLICFYTTSHEKLLFKYLIPSLNVDNGFNLVLLRGEQLCQTASYYEEGWFDTVAQKILSLINYLEKIEENTIFVFTDPDVIFLQSCSQRLIEIMKKECKDILCQDDQNGGICSGFFIAKKTKELLRLFNSMIDFISRNKVGDQKALNCLLATEAKFWDYNKFVKNERFDISYGRLPLNEFSNYGFYKKNACYHEKKIKFKVVPETKIFHANWCKGVDNKCELLDYVKNPNKFINQVYNGLANRLISIISSQRISEVSGRKLFTIWQKEDACFCEFEELFENDEHINIIKDVSEIVEEKIEPTALLMIDQIKGAEFFNRNEDLLFFKSAILNVDKSENLYSDDLIPLIYDDNYQHKFHLGQDWKLKEFESEAKLHRDSLIKAQRICYKYIKDNLMDYLNKLKIRQDILEEVENFKKQFFDENTIGFHIRLTDNPFPYVSFDTVENKIKEKLDEGYKIFLASDNKNSNDILKEKFKDRIFSCEKSYSEIIYDKNVCPKPQKRETSVREALIDLLLLSNTRHIYKPAFSTFGILAAAWGGIEYDCVYDETKVNNIQEAYVYDPINPYHPTPMFQTLSD